MIAVVSVQYRQVVPGRIGDPIAGAVQIILHEGAEFWGEVGGRIGGVQINRRHADAEHSGDKEETEKLCEFAHRNISFHIKVPEVRKAEVWGRYTSSDYIISHIKRKVKRVGWLDGELESGATARGEVISPLHTARRAGRRGD